MAWRGYACNDYSCQIFRKIGKNSDGRPLVIRNCRILWDLWGRRDFQFYYRWRGFRYVGSPVGVYNLMADSMKWMLFVLISIDSCINILFWFSRLICSKKVTEVLNMKMCYGFIGINTTQIIYHTSTRTLTRTVLLKLVCKTELFYRMTGLFVSRNTISKFLYPEIYWLVNKLNREIRLHLTLRIKPVFSRPKRTTTPKRIPGFFPEVNPIHRAHLD